MSQLQEPQSQAKPTKSEKHNEIKSEKKAHSSIRGSAKQSVKNSPRPESDTKHQPDNRDHPKSISMREWDAVYDNQIFAIGPREDKKEKREKSVRTDKKIGNEKPQNSQKKSEKPISIAKEAGSRQAYQQIQWETAYIDEKFYLSDPASLLKLRELDQEIKMQKEKLANIEAGQPFNQSFLSQRNLNDQSTQNMKMECLTEINETKLEQRKKYAEADLIREEQRYRDRIEEMKIKKLSLKKEMGCGTDDKDLQLNQHNKKSSSHMKKSKQNQKIADESKAQQFEAEESMANKNSNNIQKELLPNEVSQYKKEASVKQRSKRSASSRKDKMEVKQNMPSKQQYEVRDNKIVKENSIKKSQRSQKKQECNVEIGNDEKSGKKQEIKQNSEKGVEVHINVHSEKSAREKSQKNGEGKSEKSKGKVSHQQEMSLNLPKVPDFGKSQKSSQSKNENILQTKRSQIGEKTPSIRQKSSKSKKVEQEQIILPATIKQQPSQNSQSPSLKNRSQKIVPSQNKSIHQEHDQVVKKEQSVQGSRSMLAASRLDQEKEDRGQKKSERSKNSQRLEDCISNAGKILGQDKIDDKQKDSQKEHINTNNLLVPQIIIHPHSFKKTDKSVQWEDIDPSVSKFSVQDSKKQVSDQVHIVEKSQKPSMRDQKSMKEIPMTQKSQKSKFESSRIESNQGTEKPISEIRSHSKSRTNQQNSKNNASQVSNQQQKSKQSKEYVVNVNFEKSKDQSQISQDRNQEQQSQRQNQKNVDENGSQLFFDEGTPSRKKSKVSQSQVNYKHNMSQEKASVSENSLPSEKKKAYFKISSRENSLDMKKSRSRSRASSVDQNKNKSEAEEFGKNIKGYEQKKGNSEVNQSDSRVSREEIRRLHDQILELQEKLKKVEEKQHQMIKFENNQSKEMSDIGGSNTGSEPASPIGKLGLTSRLKLQAKLTLETSTVNYNTHEQKMKRTAEQNEKLEKLLLQEEIGRLKKIIRDMQMQKIMSIEYDQNNLSKVEIRRPSVLDAAENNSRFSVNSELQETRKSNEWGNQTIKEDAGKIKKNSPIKQSIKYSETPRKYNKINAQKIKNFSEVAKDEEKQEAPLPQRLKVESAHQNMTRSRKARFQQSNNRVENQEKVDKQVKNLNTFFQASRILNEPESIMEPVNTSIPDAFEHKEESQLSPSQINSSPPENIKPINRNFFEIIQKMKHENPQDELATPDQIKVGTINMPNLPECPNLTMTQDDLLDLAKKTYVLFGVDVDEDQNQLSIKKYKNCVVFTYGADQQRTILWHYSGKFYYGGWKNTSDPGEGEKIGEGLEYTPGKHIYKGQFLGGKKNGNGILKMTNGNIYDGQWVDGTKNGRGSYFESSTGTFYSGQWKNGKRDGYGILKFSNTEFYQGTFSMSIKQGYGIQKFANGDHYKGEYHKGKFNGKGKYFWSNGSSYEGDFLDGLRHGQGSWKSSRTGGDIYLGGYENDKKCGYGRYVWGNGCVYEGLFKNDLKHGKGRLVYQDNKEIKGSWEDGNLMTSEQESRRMQDHEEQPLKKSIRASSLRTPIQSSTIRNHPLNL